jgi:hypothetical protein
MNNCWNILAERAQHATREAHARVVEARARAGREEEVTPMTKNRWHCPEGTEPLLAWTVSAPAPSSAQARAFVDEVMAAGRATGVLVAGPGAVAGSGELLPWEGAVYAGAPVPFSSHVVVRDRDGGLVSRVAGDAGALLRSLEPLEPAYARRFAASRPFAAAWSTASPATLTITIAFLTNLWLDHGDPGVQQANARGFDELRASLAAIARRRGGRLVAPPSPTAG